MTATKLKLTIPTYPINPDEPNPMFYEKRNVQGASGKVFPMQMNSSLGSEKRDVEYDAVRMENEYIALTLLPQLGGKVYRALDKMHSYDFIYYNRVIKPALIGNCGPWTSGGIEFNWPQHHRPTTFLPVEYQIENNPDGSTTCWMGETEPMTRMRGRVGITMYPGRSYMHAKIRLYNRTDITQSFMWWANLAVAVNRDYRAVFPPDITWSSDHAWAVTSPFPIMPGVYKGHDFGDGADVRDYNQLPTSASFFTYNSKYDFLSGYDFGRDSGTVHIADRHTAPGKKMFTWGTSPFAQAWYKKLTDEDGPYIELMTGVFTRNQPDFSWIAPHEYKQADQYWYPIHGIGAIKNATLDAALAFDINDDAIELGLNVTGVFKNLRAAIYRGDAQVFSETLSYIRPGDVYKKKLPRVEGAAPHELRAVITDEGGRVLVDYQPEKPAEVTIPKPFEPTPEPGEIKSNEELYLHALHLFQYRHPYLEPDDYIAEALRRDPGDARCNALAALIALSRLNPDAAISHADRAIERLTLRNPNPYDTEGYYLKGIAHMWRGEYDAAYEALFAATWRHAEKSQSYALLAVIAMRRGDYALAAEHARNALLAGGGNQLALWALSAIGRLSGDSAGRQAALARLKALDGMDVLYHAELAMDNRDFSGEELNVCLTKPEYALDAAYRYMQAGLYEDAAALLEWQFTHAPRPFPPLQYALGFAYGRMGRDYDKQRLYLRAAQHNSAGVMHSRPEALIVLRDAIDSVPTDATAPYYLGNIYYSNGDYAHAREMYELSIERGAKFPTVYRNLSQLYFDKCGDEAVRAKAGELIKDAFKRDRHDACVFFELCQYLKITDVPADERTAIFERFEDLTAARDDNYTNYIEAVMETGDFEKAEALLGGREFNSYEGGEGVTMRLHSWAYAMDGAQALLAGENEKALKKLTRALDIDPNYREGEGWLPRELGHVYYWRGLTKAAMGDTEGARHDYEQCALHGGQNAGITELLFRRLCCRALGLDKEADAALEAARAAYNKALGEVGRYFHFAHGPVSYKPYELNKRRMDERALAFPGAWLNAIDGDADAFKKAFDKYPVNFTLAFAAKHADCFGI